jgi:tetratricopeptide (TPR) repeat protein
MIAVLAGSKVGLRGDAIPVAPPDDEQARAVRTLSERYIDKGEELEKIGDLNGAILDYSEAIRVDPDNPDAHVHRGKARLEMKDSDGALRDFSEAIEVDPKYAEAYYHRGRARHTKEDYRGALEDLDEAVEINPSRKEYFLDRGQVRFKVRDYAGAADDFDRLSMMARDSVSVILRRGLAQLYAGNAEEAAEDFNKALRLNPRVAHAYYFRGLYKLNKGLYEGAEIDISKAMELNPKSCIYAFARGTFRFGTGNQTGAREDFEYCEGVGKKNQLQDYVALWIWLLDARSHGQTIAGKKLNMYFGIREFEIVDPWYEQIVLFLTGETSEEVFLQSAAEFPEKKQDERFSHAAFFAAQKRLLENDNRDARNLLLKCIDKGHLGAFEFHTARLQLGWSEITSLP